MTIDELLDPAGSASKIGSPAYEGRALAKGVLRLLGHPWPCGWPEPVAERGAARIWWESLGDEPLTPDEALALAAGLIRAAMEARR